METATFDLVALQGPGCTRRVLDLPCAAILAEIPRPHLGPGCRFGLRLRLRRLLDGVGGARCVVQWFGFHGILFWNVVWG